jgi:hypothetical protein
MAQGSYKIISICSVFMFVAYTSAMHEFELYDPLPEEPCFDMHDPWLEPVLDFPDSNPLVQTDAALHAVPTVQGDQSSAALAPQPIQMAAAIENPQALPEETQSALPGPAISGSDSYISATMLDIAVMRQLYESIVQLKKCIYDVHQKVIEHEQRFNKLDIVVQSLKRLIPQVSQITQKPVVAQAVPFFPYQEQLGTSDSVRRLKIAAPTVPVQPTIRMSASVYQQQQGSALYVLLRNRYLQVQREREQQAADARVELASKRLRK